MVGLGAVSTKSFIKIICEENRIMLNTILTAYLDFSVTLVHTHVFLDPRR